MLCRVLPSVLYHVKWAGAQLDKSEVSKQKVGRAHSTHNIFIKLNISITLSTFNKPNAALSIRAYNLLSQHKWTQGWRNLRPLWSAFWATIGFISHNRLAWMWTNFFKTICICLERINQRIKVQPQPSTASQPKPVGTRLGEWPPVPASGCQPKPMDWSPCQRLPAQASGCQPKIVY